MAEKNFLRYGHLLESYNPESVVKCMLKGKIANYWGRTSTYAVITDRLKHNYKGAKDDIIKMLSGESIKVNVTRYMNTMTDFHSKDDVFTYLIHLGYLAYNSEDETCRIPNLEVRKEWYNAIEDMPDYSKTDEIIKASEELQRSFAFGSHQLRRGDENPYVQD